MIVHDVQQGTSEWFDVRRGVFTASIASKLLTPTGKLSAQRNDEVARLVAERLGLQEPGAPFSTEWTDRGIEMESEARNWFAFAMNLRVEQVGFVKASFSEWIGCSPDGLVELKYPLELKCPKPSTHLRWLVANELPKEHVQQVHFQMAAMQAEDAFFMSYCPPLRPLIIPVEWTEYTDAMRDAIDTVIEELDQLYDEARGVMQ